MAKGHSAPAILQMARVEGRQMIDKKKKKNMRPSSQKVEVASMIFPLW